MLPHRPWLFKVQNPGQAQDQAQAQAEARAQNQDQAQAQAQTNAPIAPEDQVQAQNQLRSNTPAAAEGRPQLSSRRESRSSVVRDWVRRYNPAINSRVYGYPSTGGVLILPGYIIDLPLLGLNRYTESRRSVNQMEEDEFCRRLRYLGAIWWPFPDADLEALRGQGPPEEQERAATHVCVGWLPHGGGVWVLKYSENDQDNNDLSLKAQRIGSLNMVDRCRMIEELGGKYYRHPEECEDLRWGNWPSLSQQ